MEVILYVTVFVVGAALGVLTAKMMGMKKLSELQLESERLRGAVSGLQQLRDAEAAQLASVREDNTRFQADFPRILSELEHHKTALESERKRSREESERLAERESLYRHLQEQHTETLTALERCRTALEKEQGAVIR